MTAHDLVGLPWKAGGNTHEGVDCAGLAWLWLTQVRGLSIPAPGRNKKGLKTLKLEAGACPVGGLLFFRSLVDGEVCHVAACLEKGKLLHILNGFRSRIDNGPALLGRLKLVPAGWLSSSESAIQDALACVGAGAGIAAQLVIAAIAIAASYAISNAMQPSFTARRGKYSVDALLTQQSPRVPLPELLGSVVVAGNSVYRQLPDVNDLVDSTAAKWCQIVVLSSAPVSEIDFTTGLKIKGLSWEDRAWHNDNLQGISLNPAQTKAEAITGDIGADTKVPSMTLYDGSYGISVPVDIRAQYDRNFPIYGMAGCAYLVGRWIGSVVFANFNLTCRIRGKFCRQFDAVGFLRVRATDNLTSGAATRYKLTNEDIACVESISEGLTLWTEISATNQSGRVYFLNRTKGYIEFPDQKPAASFGVTYTYYARAWTQNPASHIIHLLTDSIQGRGFDESRIDWASAYEFAQFCSASVDWSGPNGVIISERCQTNYAVDEKKPLQDHLQALLDASQCMLVLANGRFSLLKRTAGSSVFSFDSSNILVDENGASTFSVEIVDRASKPNRVKVAYSSEDNLDSVTSVVADDLTDQESRAARAGNGGIVESEIELAAVASASQASRLAAIFLGESAVRKIFKWKTTVQGLALLPGDLVDVTHLALGVTAVLCRIESLEHATDDIISIVASEYPTSVY
jgi:hypothetical protein